MLRNLFETKFHSTFFFVLYIRELSCAVVTKEDAVSSNTFDFIIVGGGTAGCVLAHRLTENGSYSVLLLEAGGDPPEFLTIPGLTRKNLQIPELTFQYQSVRQRHSAFGNNGGVLNLQQGRVLGGTSQINYNMFSRGSPMDFDNWANITGDSIWEYSNILKYFKRSETYLGQFPSESQHGSNGPITVSSQKYGPGREAWLAAGRELGFEVRDLNGPQEISFTPIEFSRKSGRRVSSYSGYIKPILGTRGNLKIVKNAYVTQVIIEGDLAKGVKYAVNGTPAKNANTFAFAKREIILSAGTYGSATILMRSGIGPREVLESAGIPVVKENFQDHPEVPIYIVLNDTSISFDPIRDLTPENLELFHKTGEGPYSDVIGYSGLAMLASSVAASEGHSSWPDMQLCHSSQTTRTDQFKDFYVGPSETSTLVNLVLGREKSRGTVKLNPADIFGMPLIDQNFLSDPRDEQIFLGMINATLNIFENTKTFQRLGARIFKEPLPACGHFPFRAEHYWRCYIRQTTRHHYHPSSTCSMNSVVDSKLKVIGITGLRVVDASIMPVITNTNLQAAVYGIAELGSDIILREHGQ